MQQPTHTVRAQAFHHQDGYRAKRHLAGSFAGFNGRIATMEDIVDARLATDTSHLAWRYSFVTNSFLYVGLHKSRPHAVIAHGTGPTPVNKSDLLEFKGRRVAYGSSLRTEALDFKMLMKTSDKQLVIDLTTYESTAKTRGSINEFLSKEAYEDPLVCAILGRRAEEYIMRQRDETHAWLKGYETDEVIAEAKIIRNMFHLFHETIWHRRIEEGKGAALAYPLGIERPYFFVEDQKDSKHILGHVELFGSDEEDFHGARHYVVGIRGKAPITDIARDLHGMLPGIKDQPETFLVPATEADGLDSLVQARTPHGPYFVERYGQDLYTSDYPWGRDERKITTSVAHPTTFKLSVVPEVDDGGGRATRPRVEALKLLPEGANAILLKNGTWGTGGSMTFDCEVEFFQVELDLRPCHVLLKNEHNGRTTWFTQELDRTFEHPEDSPLTQRALCPVTQIVEIASERSYQVEYPRTAPNMPSPLTILTGLMPPGANAVHLSGYARQFDEANGRPSVWVHATYYHVTIDTPRRLRRYEEMREDFDWLLDRCEPLGLTKLPTDR